VLVSITGLIAAIAALVGALSGFVGMLIVVRRTSPRERRDAAQGAAEKMLAPPNTGNDAAQALIDVHNEQHRGGPDSDEPGPDRERSGPSSP
jgi:hypothetical protein